MFRDLILRMIFFLSHPLGTDNQLLKYPASQNRTHRNNYSRAGRIPDYFS